MPLSCLPRAECHIVAVHPLQGRPLFGKNPFAAFEMFIRTVLTHFVVRLSNAII